jgi:peptidoglycan/LPS O-acetylase OafA/YrhL
MAAPRAQVPLVDAIKAVAAQLIVLHHLAWYGPMSDVAAGFSPLLDSTLTWLAQHGRYAVAAFLVVAGYLAAGNLSPRGLAAGQSALGLIGKRYARLVGPYAAALLLAILGAALVRPWMTHESVGAAVELGQFVAHLFLLQGILGIDALSAGVWYIAIDFQLYALLVTLLWAATQLDRRLARTDFWGLALVTFLACLSLFHFNRDSQWDNTGLYFFGLYALGIGSRWATDRIAPWRTLWLITLVGVAALSIDFRARLALALGVALLLGCVQLRGRAHGSPHWLAGLGRTSYALFLVHFPVCLLVNALIFRLAPDSALLNLFGLLLAWGASNAAALLFYRHVEVRMMPWLCGFFASRRIRTGAG